MTDAVVSQLYVIVSTDGGISDGSYTRLYAEVWHCGTQTPPECSCDWTGKTRQYRPARSVTQSRNKFVQGPHPVFSRGKKSFFDEV